MIKTILEKKKLNLLYVHCVFIENTQTIFQDISDNMSKNTDNPEY